MNGINKIKSLQQDKNNIFELFLESQNDSDVLYNQGKKFLEQAEPEPLFSIQICEKIHKLIEAKEIQSKKIKSIIDNEEIWKKSISFELLNKHHDYKEEIEIIKKNKELYDSLPNVIKPNSIEFQKKMLEASMLMVKSAYRIYNDSIARLKSNNQQQQQQQEKMDVDSNIPDEAIDSKSLKIEYFNSFNKTLDKSIKDILPNLALDVAKFLQENQLPMVCAKVCKELAIKINNERENEKKTLVKSECSDLDQVMYNVIECCINSIFNTITKLEQKAKVSPHLITDRELQDLTILKNGELLKEFIEFVLPNYLQNPEGIIKIGQSLLNINQYNHVVLVAERGRIRLENLKKEQLEKEALQTKINLLEKDIASIEKVSGNVDEKKVELFTLKQQFAVYNMYPRYYSMDKKEFSKHNLDVATLRIKSILEMKEASKGTLNIQAHLDDTLKTLLDPNHIYQLAILLQKSEMDTALVYGERCQRIISDLEILRQVRLPLVNQINKLESEVNNLRADGRTISEEKKAELEALKTKISTLPEFPFFSDLNNCNEYDRLNLQVAQMMITCVLEKKAKASLSKDQSQKDRLNKQVSDLINMCLEKFKDPHYLLELEKHLKTSREDHVMIQIANQIFNRCTEIEKLRVERVALENKEKECTNEAEKQQLSEQIKKLPLFPYYASLNTEHQYDNTIYESAEVLMNFLIDNVAFIDEKLRKAKLFSIKNIEDQSLIKEKEELNQLITQSLKTSLTFIKSPTLVCKLAYNLGAKRESLFLDVAKHIHPILNENHKVAIELKRNQFLVEALNQELSELAKMKKEMPDADIQLLEETKNIVNSNKLQYVENWIDHNTFHSQLISKGIEILYKKKDELESLTNSIPKSELPSLVKANKENIDQLFELLTQYLEDPSTFVTILNILKSRKEFELITEIGKLSFTKLNQFRTHQKNVNSTLERKTALEEEREALNKQRRRLATDKHEALREINVNEKLNSLLPSYYSTNLDQLSLTFGNVLIETNTEERLDFEKKASSKAFEGQFKYISEQRKRINDNISQTIKLVVDNIESLETLIQFANQLYAKKEYMLVLQVGQIIETTLENKKNIIEHKESLLQESKVLQSKYLHSTKPAERATIQPLIDQNQKDYEAIVLTHTYEEIKQLTTSITTIMIESASIEDQGDILREQLILSFKTTTSPLDWDRIRNISNEEEWEETKKQLVKYIMAREENVNCKIELLLKDSLFEEAIQIFPLPSVDNEQELDIQLNLLVSLYDAVDEHAFHLLNNILPIIQRYAKRCYLEWKYEKLDTIFESLQKRFPTEIKDIFQTSIDMLVVNILPSQYPIFLNMLKAFKNRMVNVLGLNSLWESFLDNFKKNNKTKKRLIQMIAFIGDSVYQITLPKTANSTTTNARKAKRSIPATSSQSTLKKIKVTSAFAGVMVPKKAVASSPSKVGEEEEEEQFQEDESENDEEMGNEEIDPTDEEDN